MSVGAVRGRTLGRSVGEPEAHPTLHCPLQSAFPKGCLLQNSHILGWMVISNNYRALGGGTNVPLTVMCQNRGLTGDFLILNILLQLGEDKEAENMILYIQTQF